MKKLFDLEKDRAQIVEQQRAMLDAASKDGRELTTEEVTKYDELDVKGDALKATMDRIVKTEQIENEMDEKKSRPALTPNLSGDFDVTGMAPAGSMAAKRLIAQPKMGLKVYADGSSRARVFDHPFFAEQATPFGDAAYEDAFELYLRMGRNALSAAILNILEIGTDSAGGFLTPEEFETRLVEARLNANVIRSISFVFTTGADRNIPLEVSTGAAAWTPESGLYPEDDPVFDRRTLGAFKLTRLVRVSEELNQDAFFPMGAYLADNFGKTFGTAEELAFAVGDGTDRPTGFTVDADTTNLAVAATITGDELIDLFHTLKRVYRPSATWLANDDTIKVIRKIKDTTDQYLWQPGLQAGEPDLLLGRPILASDGMDLLGTPGNIVLAFGDFSFYYIADRRGIFFQRLDERYADLGQIGYRSFERVDARLMLDEAIQTFTDVA